MRNDKIIIITEEKGLQYLKNIILIHQLSQSSDFQPTRCAFVIGMWMFRVAATARELFRLALANSKLSSGTPSRGARINRHAFREDRVSGWTVYNIHFTPCRPFLTCEHVYNIAVPSNALDIAHTSVVSWWSRRLWSVPDWTQEFIRHTPYMTCTPKSKGL